MSLITSPKKEPKNKILATSSYIQQNKDLEIGVGNAEELLNDAKAALKKKKFEEALKIANKAMETAKKSEKEYKIAMKYISKLDEGIKTAEEERIDVSEPEKLLNYAKNLFKLQEYNEVVEVIKEAVEKVNKSYNLKDEALEILNDALLAFEEVKNLSPNITVTYITVIRDLGVARKNIIDKITIHDDKYFEDIINIAKRATKNAKDQYKKLKKAFDAIDKSVSQVNNAFDSGIVTEEDIKNLITIAKDALENNDYEKTMEYTSKIDIFLLNQQIINKFGDYIDTAKIEELLSDTILTIKCKEYDDALLYLKQSDEEVQILAKEALKSTQQKIEEGKEYVDTSNVEDIFDKTNTSMKNKDLFSAFGIIKQCEKELERTINEAKPSVSFKISSNETLLEYKWSSIDITIVNKGKAHAKDILIKLSGPFSVHDIDVIPVLNVGESKLIKNFIKFDGWGKMPIDVHIKYHRPFDDKEYTSTKVCDMEVQSALAPQKLEMGDMGIKKL